MSPKVAAPSAGSETSSQKKRTANRTPRRAKKRAGVRRVTGPLQRGCRVSLAGRAGRGKRGVTVPGGMQPDFNASRRGSSAHIAGNRAFAAQKSCKNAGSDAGRGGGLVQPEAARLTSGLVPLRPKSVRWCRARNQDTTALRNKCVGGDMVILCQDATPLRTMQRDL